MSYVVLALLFVVLVRDLIKGLTKARFAEYVVHIQGRTEQDETIDFAVTLFQDETPADWMRKLDKAWEIREHRLKFNNDRMLQLVNQAKEGN